MSEISQAINDLEHMLLQSMEDEIDIDILIEPTAKLVLLISKTLMRFMEDSQ